MQYLNIEQRSQEWWQMKVGKVSGTRFGQLISGRENQLIDELANETLDNCCEMDDFENEDMIFGTENEPVALDLYEKQSGIKFNRGGVIVSDLYPSLHMASPDGLSMCKTIVAEVKCTMHGKTQINRFRNGVDKKHLGQIINYFAVSDKIQEVHWISYCPYRAERPLIVIKFNRNTVIELKGLKSGVIETTIQDKVNEGLSLLAPLQTELTELVNNFKTIEF